QAAAVRLSRGSAEAGAFARPGRDGGRPGLRRRHGGPAGRAVHHPRDPHRPRTGAVVYPAEAPPGTPRPPLDDHAPDADPALRRKWLDDSRLTSLVIANDPTGETLP